MSTKEFKNYKIRFKIIDKNKLNGYNNYALIIADVAQSVEHFLGKEEVRQFKPAQQLQSFFIFKVVIVR